MRGRLLVLAREELLLQTLIGLIQAVVAAGAECYSQLLAEVYAELMRTLLVQQAVAGTGLARPESLLYQASFAIERRVQERLGAVHFDWSRYKDHLGETFKAPAKEILALQEALKAARRREELPLDAPSECGDQVPFHIAAIGLHHSDIQGLIAAPDSYPCYLDFSRVTESCTVQGNWFPFELIVQAPAVGALVFVVDQDGSIHIPTENFPTETLQRTRHVLKSLAARLHTTDETDDDSAWVDL